MNYPILKKYIHFFHENKITLIKYWFSNEEIIEFLKEHEIDIEYFVKTFAFDVLTSYIEMIDKNTEISECMVIDKLVKFLKEKKVLSSQVFLLCNGLKNSFIEYIYTLEIASFEIEKEINHIFEKNFWFFLKKFESHTVKIEKELEEQLTIIVEQSKAAAMGEMISMIAHQWRQPLQFTSILIQKLSITKSIDGEISDELLDEVVEGIINQLEYMSKTIDDFRDFFLPSKPKEYIKIKDILEKAFNLLSFMIKNDSIEIKIKEKLDIEVYIYANELIQVIINIIKNSRDAFRENSIKNRKILINYYEDNNFICIDIQDNAGGIPEKIKNKIFDPYFSTKDEKNGTGLGLYMCKTIIEKYSHGTLSVRNLDDGAIFEIKLPINN